MKPKRDNYMWFDLARLLIHGLSYDSKALDMCTETSWLCWSWCYFLNEQESCQVKKPTKNPYVNDEKDLGHLWFLNKVNLAMKLNVAVFGINVITILLIYSDRLLWETVRQKHLQFVLGRMFLDGISYNLTVLDTLR